MAEPMIYACAECGSDIEPEYEVNDFGLMFCCESCRDHYDEEYAGDEGPVLQLYEGVIGSIKLLQADVEITKTTLTREDGTVLPLDHLDKRLVSLRNEAGGLLPGYPCPTFILNLPADLAAGEYSLDIDLGIRITSDQTVKYDSYSFAIAVLPDPKLDSI